MSPLANEVRFIIWGMGYYKVGDRKKALATLEKALSISDDFEGAKEAKETVKRIKKKYNQSF